MSDHGQETWVSFNDDQTGETVEARRVDQWHVRREGGSIEIVDSAEFEARYSFVGNSALEWVEKDGSD